LRYVREGMRKPVKLLVNTHFHEVHSFGNQPFDCEIAAGNGAIELFSRPEKGLEERRKSKYDPSMSRNLS